MNFVILWRLMQLKTSYQKKVMMYFNMRLVVFVHGGHVCMLECIRHTIIVYIIILICFCYLFLLQGSLCGE